MLPDDWRQGTEAGGSPVAGLDHRLVWGDPTSRKSSGRRKKVAVSVTEDGRATAAPVATGGSDMDVSQVSTRGEESGDETDVSRGRRDHMQVGDADADRDTLMHPRSARSAVLTTVREPVETHAKQERRSRSSTSSDGNAADHEDQGVTAGILIDAENLGRRGSLPPREHRLRGGSSASRVWLGRPAGTEDVEGLEPTEHDPREQEGGFAIGDHDDWMMSPLPPSPPASVAISEAMPASPAVGRSLASGGGRGSSKVWPRILKHTATVPSSSLQWTRPDRATKSSSTASDSTSTSSSSSLSGAEE